MHVSGRKVTFEFELILLSLVVPFQLTPQVRMMTLNRIVQ